MSEYKILPSQYPKIMKLITEHHMTQADVARRYGVSRKTICDIVNLCKRK